VQAFLAGRADATLRSYQGDLADFARWCGAPSVEAAGELLPSGPGGANEPALHYKTHLVGRGLAAATVNRGLAALRSLTRMGRTLGLIGWALEVEPLRAEAYRDTRGPGAEGVRRLLAQLAGRSDAQALRDAALLRLLYDLGLRRKEVVGLDVADVDLAAGVLQVLGKGRQARERVSLPPATSQALRAWLGARGSIPGPLFVALDRAHRGHRLTGQAVYGVVKGLGDRAGLRARPQGLRHAAITRALDLTGGDVWAVQRFSRHRDVRVVQRYDDCRRDLAGEVARRLAGEG
jgi:integrase/recombinase XerC